MEARGAGAIKQVQDFEASSFTEIRYHGYKIQEMYDQINFT